MKIEKTNNLLLPRPSRTNSVGAIEMFLVSIFTLAIFLLQIQQTSGQNPAPSPAATTKPANDDDPTKPKKEKRGSLLLAPVPITSPTFGSGMILGVGYVFRLKKDDKLSPPSTIGLAAAFTNGGTRGAGIGGRLYFAENKYQTSFVMGKGRAVYDFYGIGLRPGQPGVAVELHQSGGVFFGEFMRNTWKNIFIGPRYQYRKLTVHLDGAQTPGGFQIPPIDLVSTTVSVGFHVERDLRNSTFYPTKGSLWDFKADFFAKPIGSNRTYQAYKASYNGYRTIGKGQVLAYRGIACSVSDGTPFFLANVHTWPLTR